MQTLFTSPLRHKAWMHLVFKYYIKMNTTESALILEALKQVSSSTWRNSHRKVVLSCFNSEVFVVTLWYFLVPSLLKDRKMRIVCHFIQTGCVDCPRAHLHKRGKSRCFCFCSIHEVHKTIANLPTEQMAGSARPGLASFSESESNQSQKT